MDRVDRSLIDQLREIGCNIGDSRKSIQDLTVDEIMECTSECLLRIDHIKHVELSKINSGNLNMPSKFRLASNLASACNSIGYKTKLEYQTFLYGNVVDVRNLFLFLTEIVFREDVVQLKCQDEDVNDRKCNTYNISILKHKLTLDSMLPSVAVLTERKTDKVDLLFGAYESFIENIWQPRQVDLNSPREICSADNHTAAPSRGALPLMKPPIAPRRQNVSIDLKTSGSGHILSLCEWNQLSCQNNLYKNLPLFDQSDLVFDSYVQRSINDHDYLSFHRCEKGVVIKDFATTNDQATTVIDATVDSQVIHDPQQDSINCNINDFKLRTEPFTENNESLLEPMTTELNNLNSRHEQLLYEEKLFHNLEEEMRQSKKNLNDSKLASKTVEELRRDITLAENDITQFRSNWAEARSFLHQELLKLDLELSEVSGGEAVIIRKRIQDADHRLIGNQTKIKKNLIAIENLYVKVTSFKEKEHDFPRSSYVKMLNEVTKQLKKQNDDLNKILREVRALQKEINSLCGRLQRSFTLVDEALFENARSDEWNRKCYKLLATMHEECDLLIQGIECNGEVVRDILRLEEMVNMEKSKNISESLSRVTRDLQVVKDDNKTYVDTK